MTSPVSIGQRHGTGFTIIGATEETLVRSTAVAFALLRWKAVRSCVFTPEHALVSPLPAVHSPLIAPATRSTGPIWDEHVTAVHFWNWLQGRHLPASLEPAVLPSRQTYNHVEPAMAEYPIAPPMVDGRPNEARPNKDYLYYRGFLLVAGMSDLSLENTLGIGPVWVRWGPFDPDPNHKQWQDI